MVCVNPRTIFYDASFYQPFFWKEYAHNSRQQVVVGCGKCAACLSKRQNGFVQRVYNAMKTYPHAWFVTLTYRDSTLPVACSIDERRVDVETGELVWERLSDFTLLQNSELRSFVRGKLLQQKASSKPRYYTEEIPGFDSFNLYRHTFNFSVSRSDFQSWLKCSRIEYKRKFGKLACEFKYLACGEMGPKTCRPHMHCLFLSKSPEFGQQLSWFLDKWKERFGFTQMKKVQYINPDGSNGALAVAKYVSKYISKGKFDCDSVKDGYSEKGRLCASMKLGAEDFPGPMRSWYLGFDIYGRYDLNRLTLDSGRRLDLSQILHLCDVINRRCFFTFPDGKSFPMSHYYRDKLFSYYVNSQSGERQKVRYYISFLASLRLQDVQNSDFNNRLQRALVGVSEDKQQDVLKSFIKGEQFSVQNRELDSQKALESFYSNSIF